MIATIQKIERVKLDRLPAGKYVGSWCGYVITIPLQTEKWLLHTAEGIRGIAPVDITVLENGVIEAVTK